MFETITSNVTKFTMYWWFGVGFFKCNYFDHNKGGINLLFLEHSHAKRHFEHNVLWNSYNSILCHSDAFILFFLIQAEIAFS